jgi:hypothetical protein
VLPICRGQPHIPISRERVILDDQNDIIHKTIHEHTEGCRIIELNGDGRLKSNGAQMYVEEMQRLKGDIMIIIDTGMDENESTQFQRQCQRHDHELTTQAIPAIKQRGRGQVLPKGGILVIINAKWCHSVGRLHTDASNTGLLAKVKVRQAEQTYTLLIGYWPIPKPESTTADDESAAAFRRLEGWLKKMRIPKSPIRWMRDVTSTWVTVAQEAHEIPIALGDFNASNRLSLAGYLPTNGKLSDLLEDWNMLSVQEELMDKPIQTYWRSQIPISHLDHFAMIEDHISNVIDIGMDIAPHTTTMSAHKPIYLTLKATPAIEPPLPMELSIERAPDGDYVRTEACETMNIAVIDRNIDQGSHIPRLN